MIDSKAAFRFCRLINRNLGVSFSGIIIRMESIAGIRAIPEFLNINFNKALIFQIPVSTGRFFPKTPPIPNPTPTTIVAMKAVSDINEVIPRYSVGEVS